MWRIVCLCIVMLPRCRPRAKMPRADGEDLKVPHALRGRPEDKVNQQKPHKVHEHKMKAAPRTSSTSRAGKFDCYLRLEDSSGMQLAEDDDSGGGLDFAHRPQGR